VIAILSFMLPDAAAPPPPGQPGDRGGGHPAPAASPALVPELRPGQPPLAVLVDYDGTISLADVSDRILYGLLGQRYARDDAAYTAGLVGSRTLFSSQVKLLPGDPGPVIAIAEAQPHDPAFAGFVRRAIELEVPVEVVSDGFGFFIEPALRGLGVPEIPVVTARTTFEGRRARMEFPNGHPECFVCGTCKRQRVMAHQAAGRSVAFVGDGESDRYAAAYADLIFAKRELAELCRTEGWEFSPWHDFGELMAWLEATVAAWRKNPAAIPPAIPAHRPRPFICGPEVWGPGRTDPPPLAPPDGWTLAERRT
jgi:2-hydroxy-3-keto-5-methylthiopentenyl-1-phosphate phosphatase